MSAHPAPMELATVEATIRSGEMTPLHVHSTPETIRVLDGVIVVHVGGLAARLDVGAALTAPAGVPHALAGSSQEARYTVTAHTSSVERYAGFQRAVAVPDTAPVPEDEEDTVVEALAAASGITVLGPPGALVVG